LTTRDLALFSAGPRRHYAAVRVPGVVTLSALGMSEDRYVAGLWRRRMELLAALAGAGVSMLVGGQMARPFSLATLPERRPYDASVACAARRGSRARYGRPQFEVDEEIAASLRVEENGT